MSSTTNILITGANRGIGKGLLSTYLTRPNHTLIAGVRDPTSASSKALLALPRGENSKVILVKIDSLSQTDALAAVKTLKVEHNITKLDIVIANAGIANHWGQARVTPAKEMTDHFEVNVVGPLILFQATAELLDAAPAPKFFAISSAIGSISLQANFPLESSAYGTSKIALNFVLARIHFENPKILAAPVHPGWLQTEMGNDAATGVGMEQAPLSVEDGVNGIIDKLDKSTREKDSGTFISFDGEHIPW
ncbi:aflatoxin biosynthesis ketoreductase-like protein nor-1 [Hyaloscypha variabilis]